MTQADVVIVGGGVMGTSAAFHLAEAGVDVVLVERDQLGSGSTSKAAGGVRANFSDELNIALGARSLELLANFDSRPGYDIDLVRDGYLFVLTTEEQVRLFESSVELQRVAGVRSYLVDAGEAKELSPFLNTEDVIAAAWTPDDGHCTPESVVLGYAKGARNSGARILTSTEVLDIDVAGGSITAVETGNGRIDTNCVINCAGVWSESIAGFVGMTFPITPYRRELVITEPLAEDIPTAFTIDFSTSLYWHREGPGLLMGFSDPETPPGFQLGCDPRFAHRLAELLEHRAPELLNIGLKTGWAGYYEVTPDHNAMVGEWSGVSRFLYASGFSGHGFLQGPAIGEVLRDLYLNGQPEIDCSALSADRFTSGELRPERNIV